MNLDKAREYFSAYYEGTLDPGLRKAFESRLRTDDTLQADFAAFSSMMAELHDLPEEEIEVPVYLSDRIATRLDFEIAKQRKSAPVWSTWIRGLGFTGLAAAAILGAFFSLSSRAKSPNDPAQAGFVSGPSDGEQMSFSANGPVVSLRYHPSTPHTVVISSGVSGKELTRYIAESSTSQRTIQNPLEGTALFDIQVNDSPANSVLLAVPGTNRAKATTGSGSLKDFAGALSARYRIPVLCRVADVNRHMEWKLQGTTPNTANSALTPDASLVIDQRDNGILTIMDR